MHVIIEGPDGAGKTTLARDLAKRYKLAYHHEGPPPTGVNVLHHYARLLLETKTPTVFDRFHVGETIYGPLLRGGSALSPRDMQLMDKLIVGMGATLIVCVPDWEVCLKNNHEKDELIKEDSLRKIAYQCWWDTLHNHRRPYPMHNVQLYGYDREKYFGQLVRWPAAPNGVVGPYNARTLLIGEQPNGDLDLPFFNSVHSSGFLHDCLEEAGLKDPALTNAVDAKSKTRDLKAMAAAMPALTHVILLGKIADGVWNARGRVTADPLKPLKVSSLPHPQYWKRFKSSQQSEYVRMLKEASDAAAA